jgi:hypothetical protein
MESPHLGSGREAGKLPQCSPSSLFGGRAKRGSRNSMGSFSCLTSQPFLLCEVEKSVMDLTLLNKKNTESRLVCFIILPHKFRHGNAVYSLKMAKDIQALKAVSQNLMHSNISITDGVYGILSDNDVKGQIALLGQKIIPNEASGIEELKLMTKQLMEKLGVDNPPK